MMSGNFEQLLQPYSTEPSALLPVIFSIFSLWRLTGQQQMTLLGLCNEKTLYNWKKAAGKSKADPRIRALFPAFSCFSGCCLLVACSMSSLIPSLAGWLTAMVDASYRA